MLQTQILKKYALSGRCYQCLIQTLSVKTMRAWQAFEYGGPENLHLNTMAVTPAITSPMDILVKVHAASMNPLDVRMLEGYGATAFNTVKKITKCSLAPPEFPLTPGRDFSGTVVYAGKKVKSLKSGDEVWGALSPWEDGTHAEYVLANACHVSKKPNSLTHVEASSFPYAALTAWAGISTFGGLSENSSYGKKVLVTGASGGVGTFAVQLLKAWGADVTVTCSTDAVEMLQSLGADNILDYQSEDFKTNLSAFRDFDFIFDNIGGQYPELTINKLKIWKNSKYVTVVSPLLKNADDRGIILGTLMSATQAGLDTIMSMKDGRYFRWAYFIPNGCALKTIAKMIDKKQINPVIEKVYMFDETPEAYRRLLKGHVRGKLVINVMSAENENMDQKKESNTSKQNQNV